MKKLDLAGTWQLFEGKEKKSIPAQVPGDNASALLAAGRIEDPYVGTTENDVQWIGKTDWTYARSFDVPASFLAEDSVYLHFDSLDTFATVFVNGKKVGESDNMFYRQRFEVKKAIKAGTNEISVRFAAPFNEGGRLVKEHSYPIPYSPNSPTAEDSHRNLMRKVQCHFGWDWGISLPVSGIPGACYLAATSTARIEYVYTQTAFKGKDAAVTITVEALAPKAGAVEVAFALAGQTVKKTVRCDKGLNTFSETITVKNVKRWWPIGLGEQALYDLSVTVGGETVDRRIGLREIKIVTDEDKKGLSFTVRVNGVDVFCKGANWIPADAMPQRYTRERFENLLDSAVQANMNMLRVWGGGQYEPDMFYQLCDEKGIMIWHDFMFSCALYPATKDFLANVDAEVRHQLKRLRDYACIALWCGNNENVGALTWYQESRDNRDRYLVDYDRLNEGVIGKAVDECDPTRIFWPSSPCGGRNDYSNCFHQDNRGDMHYWSVWHGGKSLDAYYDVVPRFCSEFGYQSFPSMDTIRSYASEDQFNVTAPVMEHHQKNKRGNSIITEMFSRYFRIPEGFDNFVYLSQVQQGICIRTAVEYWRSLRPVCMGALYWQLNDNWPVCSWASLNYDGSWKILHYMAKRFFAPVMLTVFQRKYGNPVEIWGVNDRLEDRNGTMTVKMLDFSGKTLWKESKKVVLPKNASRKFAEYPVAKLTDKPDEVFLLVEFTTAEGTIRNNLFLTEYKRCALPKAEVAATVEEKGGVFTVTLRTSAPAFFVTVEAEGIAGGFDDNTLTLLPGEKHTLTFTPKGKVSRAALEKALTVRHLRQTYA